MKLNKSLLWHQGLFLQPQHLQYLDRFHTDFAIALESRTRPYFWGLIDLDIDTDALLSGAFSCRRVTALFADGSLASYPENAVLESRNFDAHWTDRKQNLPVYLAVRRFSASDGNLTTVGAGENKAGVKSRYVTQGPGVDLPDQGDGQGSASVRMMDVVLRICFGAEKDAMDGYVFLQIAELTQQGKEFRLDEHFIPACINISLSRVLNGLLVNLKNNMVGRSRVLESYKTAGLSDQTGLNSAAVSARLALLTIARYVPLLMHFVDGERYHPADVYAVLRQLAGELSTFSNKLDLNGDGMEAGVGVPSYSHDDIGGCFKAVIETIGVLLNELTIGPELIASLTREGNNKFSGGLSRDFFDPKHTTYLVLRTRDNVRGWLDSFINHSKLGALGQVDVYARRALPGVGLMYLQGKPIGVSGQPNSHYFMIEREGYEWGYVHDGGYLGMIWNDAPQDLMVDVLLVRG